MCLRNFNVGASTTEKETTTPVDGKFKDFDYKQLSFRASLDGVLYRETTENTLFDFAQAQLNFLEINFRAVYEDEAGAVKVIRGQAIVMDTNLEASAGNVGAGTVELLGKGLYVIEDTLPQFVNLRILIYNNPSAQAFVKFWLINGNGEAIFQTDLLPQANGSNLANPLDITVPVPKGMWYYWFQMTSNFLGNQFDLNAPPVKVSVFNNGVYNEGSFPTQLYDFTADREVKFGIGVAVPPPTCVPPALVQGLNSPSGTVGSPWQGSVVLSGSQPFLISNVVMPAGMTIALVNNVVTFNWAQPVAGLNQPISFDFSNACGSVSPGYIDDIDISANPSAILINYTFDKAAGISFGVFRLFINAVLQVAASNDISSNVFAVPGDVIEVQVSGSTSVTKHIDIQATVDGEIYNQTQSPGLTILKHTFTGVAGNDYQINASTS
jgi:hypothetical protein